MNQNSNLAFKFIEFEWPNDITKLWKLTRLKSVAELIMGQSPSSTDCSDTPLGLPFLQGCAEFGDTHPNPEQFCLAPPKVALAGSILMSVRAPVGRLNVADQDYGIGRGLCGIIPDGVTLFVDFAYYQLQAIENALRLVSTGSTYEAVSTGDIGGQVVIIPPLAEQVAIVIYLDYADQIVRGGVSQKQKLVELMEDYKRAVIQQAVTRGLDPDVLLKPSGVEWLGDIPEHWEVCRIKSVCRFSYGDSLSSEDRIDGPIPVFGSNGQVDFHISANTNGPCIVIGRKGSFGKVHYSENPVFAIDTTFFVDSRFTDENLRYLSYLLRTLSLDGASRDSAVPGLSREDAYQHMVAIPPLAEQATIVAHLDKLTSDIDAAIAQTRREIELLEEYRTRLIADVVTGKLDVREAAANLPDSNLDDLQPLAESGEADD